MELDEADARDAMILGRAMIQFLKLYAYEADLTKDIIVSAKDKRNGAFSPSLQMRLARDFGCRIPSTRRTTPALDVLASLAFEALFREQLEALQRAANPTFRAKCRSSCNSSCSADRLKGFHRLEAK